MKLAYWNPEVDSNGFGKRAESASFGDPIQ